MTEHRRKGRWTRGSSGNPTGKPRGSRNRVSLMLEKIMADDGKEVAQAVVKAAKEGDMQAARLVLERLCPPVKGRRVHLDLPPIENAEDVARAMSAVVQAMGRGIVSPEEAGHVANIIELRRRSIETQEIQARLLALEEAAEQRGRTGQGRAENGAAARHH